MAKKSRKKSAPKSKTTKDRRIALRPFVSAGELYVSSKGEAELVPLSLFQTENGNIVFRVGETTYWFGSDGVYDGPEVRAEGTDEDRAKLAQLLMVAGDNKGKAPATSYFMPGSAGHAAETALWPVAKKDLS